jgi:predicted DNA-binding protein
MSELKIYLNGIFKVFITIIITGIFGLISMTIYPLLFGGFPYSIIKFSIIISIAWFIIIGISVFIFRSVIIKYVRISTIFFAFTLYGVLGLIFGLSSLHNKYMTTNYNFTRERLDSAESKLSRNSKFLGSLVNQNITFRSESFMKHHQQKLDSLSKQSVKTIRLYLSELKQLKLSEIENIYFYGIIDDIEVFLNAKIRNDEAYIRLSDKDFLEVLPLFLLQCALILGFFRGFIEILPK